MYSRLKAYLKFKEIPINQLEKEINVGASTLSKALKNNNVIGIDKIEKILLAYPDLSAEWLMRGNGEMILHESVETKDQIRIKMLEQQIEALTKEKDNYWSLLQHVLNETK